MNEKPTITSIKDELEKVASLVSTARCLLAEGRIVDLGNMEERVKTLCNDIRQTISSDDDDIKAQMNAIIKEMNALETELTSLQGQATDEETSPRNAANAYAKNKSDT